MAKPETIDVPSILDRRWTTTTTLHPTTTIAYNLALGAKGTNLAQVYEGHPDFAPLPTYPTTFAIAAMSLVHADMPSFLPAFESHNHVHASHWLRLHNPLPPTGTLTHTARCVSVEPARNGIELAFEIRTTATDRPTTTLVTQEWTSIVLRVPTDSLSKDPHDSADYRLPRKHLYHPPSNVKPDRVRTHATSHEQAALYRAASGDLNPLHIDPATARRAGFAAPLMTGTCTVGTGVRLVMEEFGGKVEEVRCRLRRPVHAGEVVRVEMWEIKGRKSGEEKKVVWRMVVAGGGGADEKVVVDGAVVAFEWEAETAKL